MILRGALLVAGVSLAAASPASAQQPPPVLVAPPGQAELWAAVDRDGEAHDAAAGERDITALLATDLSPEDRGRLEANLAAVFLARNDLPSAEAAWARGERVRPGPAQLDTEVTAAGWAGVDAGLIAIDRMIARHPEALHALDLRGPGSYIGHLVEAKRDAVADALVRRLLAVGYSSDDAGARRELATFAVKSAARAGRTEVAVSLLPEVTSRADLTAILTDRRYAALWPAAAAQAGPHMTTAEARMIAAAERAAAAAPERHAATWELIRAYLLAGRLADGDRAGRGFAVTPDALAALDEDGGWAVNQHALVLRAMGRADAADARLAAFFASGMDDLPWLVNLAINRLDDLVARGRYRDAEALLAPVGARVERHGSPYARQLIRRARLCTVLGLDARADVASLLADLRAHEADSRDGTVEGLMCAGRVEEAEAVMLRWLRTDDPARAIAALQPPGAVVDEDFSAWRSYAALRDRPAVRAAYLRVGRDLPTALWPAR